MRYTSENRLFDFVFHDSEITLCGYDGQKLMMKAEFVNLSRNSPYNDEGFDMQMSEAVITFDGFGVNSFTSAKWWQKPYDEEDEQEIFYGKPRFSVDSEATEKFVSELEGGMSIQEFGIDSDGYHYMNVSGKNGWFCVKFLYYNVTVQWEEFTGAAWYEKKGGRAGGNVVK